MRKCLLLLPTAYNNGQPVEPAKLKNALGDDNLIGVIRSTVLAKVSTAWTMGQWPMMFASKWWRFARISPSRFAEIGTNFAVRLRAGVYLFRETPTTVEFVRGN